MKLTEKERSKITLYNNIRNQLQRRENPERYGFITGNILILCQIDEEEDRVLITSGKAHSQKAKSICSTLFDDSIINFCERYEGFIENGGYDCEQAFIHWLIIQLF